MSLIQLPLPSIPQLQVPLPQLPAFPSLQIPALPHLHLCVTSPLPSLDSILSGMQPSLTFPPALPSIAIPGLPRFGLPSLPSPMFPNLRIPNLEMVTAAIELQAAQLQTTLLNMAKPMLSLLNMSLDDWLGKIPGLPVGLLDLLSGNPDVIIAHIKAAILNKIPQIPGLPLLPIIPTIPDPLYARIRNPAQEAVHTMQALVSNYMQILTAKLTALVKAVTDKLKIGIPAFPTIPTPQEIMDMVLAQALAMLPSLPHIPTIDELVDHIHLPPPLNLSLAQLMAGIVFPGLPPLPVLPDPLIPSFRKPAVEFAMYLTSLCNNLVIGMMKPVMDFIDSTLTRFLSFTFPVLCIDI